MPFSPALAIPRTRPAPTIYRIMAGAGGRFWSATMKRPEMIPFRRRSSIYERDTYRAPYCKSPRAYVKLWCIPENSPEASLLIVSIGSCEIRHDSGAGVQF